MKQEQKNERALVILFKDKEIHVKTYCSTKKWILFERKTLNLPLHIDIYSYFSFGVWLPLVAIWDFPFNSTC